jgi:hypothetical protein
MLTAVDLDRVGVGRLATRHLTTIIGYVWFSVDSRLTLSTTLRMPGQRDQMRQMSAISSLDYLRKNLLAE